MVTVNKSLEEVVDFVKSSKEYKKCILLKKQMDSNEEVLQLIRKVKNCQKNYVKSNYDESLKKDYEALVNTLKSIPVYSVYMQNLEVVNYMIDYIRDFLNDYFYRLLNSIEK